MNAKRDGASVEWRLRPDRNQRKIKALKRPYLLYTHEPPFGRFEKEFLQHKTIVAETIVAAISGIFCLLNQKS